MANSVRSPNRLLAALQSADFELLRPHLKTVELVHGEVLFDAGDPIKRAYFPHCGIISLVVALKGRRTIEVAMIGRDSVVGGSLAFGSGWALNKGIVLAPGVASIIDANRIRKAAETSAALRNTLFRHEQVTSAQAQHSAACNLTHTVEARLSRWLLRSNDLLGGGTLPVTQDLLAQMLGVRRTSVSPIANNLKKAGLIKYAWGRIQIVDLERLRDEACACYVTVKAKTNRLLMGSQKRDTYDRGID
jgi:CRP-like cAMP-binding protein